MGELRLKGFSAQGHIATNLMALWPVLAVITKAVSLLPDPGLTIRVRAFDSVVHVI